MRTQREELEHRRTLNQHASVQSLPNEIFVEICCMVLDSFGVSADRTWFGHLATISCIEWERQVVAFLANISAVCSAWRNISLSAPVLWRKISLAQVPERKSDVIRDRLEAFLARSKTVTLDLYITLGSRSKSGAPFEHWESLARILIGSIERCRTFHLMYWPDSASQQATTLLPLRGPLLSLQDLEFELSTTPEEVPRDLVILSPENISPLRRLKVLIPWATVYPVLQNMRTENITSIFFDSEGADWKELVDFISKCPNVAQIWISTVPAPPVMEGHPTVYSQLTALSIVDTLPPTFPKFMVAPALQELSISVRTSRLGGPPNGPLPSFTSLTHLTLRHLDFTMISPSTLYHFLRRQPCLSTIVISWCKDIVIFLRLLSDVEYARVSLGLPPSRNSWAEEFVPQLRLLSLESSRQPRSSQQNGDIAALLGSLLDQRERLCVEYDRSSFHGDEDSIRALVSRGRRFVELPRPGGGSEWPTV